jgi:hypothetical protein
LSTHFVVVGLFLSYGFSSFKKKKKNSGPNLILFFEKK